MPIQGGYSWWGWEQAAAGGATALSQRYAADFVSDSNITLSGEQSIDGTTTSASTVLCIGQSLTKTNGVYTTAAGAWSRVAALDSDADLADWIARSIEVQVGKGGTSYGLNGYGGLLYRIRPISTATTLGTDGLPWEVVPGDYPLYSNVLASPAAQIDVSDIPPIDGAKLRVDFSGMTTVSASSDAVDWWMGTSGTLDTTTGNYNNVRLYSWAATSPASDTYRAQSPGGLSKSTTDVPGCCTAVCFNYAGTDHWKSRQAEGSLQEGSLTSHLLMLTSSAVWENTSPVDIMRLIPGSGSFETGTSINVWIEVT